MLFPDHLPTGAGRALLLVGGLTLTGCGLASLIGPAWPQGVVLGVSGALTLAAGTVATVTGLRASRLVGMAVAIVSLVLPWIAFRAAAEPDAISAPMAHALVATGVVLIATFVLLSLQVRSRASAGRASASPATSRPSPSATPPEGPP